MELILNELKKAGKISDDDIRKADARIRTPQREATVAKLHLILCDYDHERTCKFAMEGNNWNAPSHASWFKLAGDLLIDLEIGWDSLGDLMLALSTIASLDPYESITSLLTSLSTKLSNFLPETIADNSPSTPDDC